MRHGRSRRLVPPDHPLATGATPGGCIDLDDVVHDQDEDRVTAGDTTSTAIAHDAPSTPTAPPGHRHDDGSEPPAQLDLLAG